MGTFSKNPESALRMLCVWERLNDASMLRSDQKLQDPKLAAYYVSTPHLAPSVPSSFKASSYLFNPSHRFTLRISTNYQLLAASV